MTFRAWVSWRFVQYFVPALVGGYWANHWIYWAGPLVGGALAGLLYSLIYLKELPRPVAR